MNRIFIILIFLLYFPTKVVPSDYYFSIIDGEMNLSHNNVKSIIQDSYGFMWFGTRNKLNRYDGITLKVFDCNDQKTKKRNNNISSLFEDVDKKMWVGTDNGIFIFDPITERFSSFEVKTAQGVGITQWIADIQQDLDNNIWIVVPNQGVFKYNRVSNKLFLYTVVKELRPSISNPQCIAVEKSGRVWIGTNGSGLFLYNKENDSFIQYLGDKEGGESLLGKNIYTICHSGDYLIVGIHEGKLVKLDKRKNIVMDLPFPEVNYKIIRHITILNDDEIWVGTQSGLYILNEKTRIVEHAKEEALNSHALSDNIVEKIYKDKEGGIWIGTNFGGVNYLPNRNNKFEKYFPLSESNSLVSKRVREMREDSRGNIWIGTEDAGIALFNPLQRKFKNIDNLFYKKTLALLVQDTKVWVGYFKHNLDIIDIQNQNKVTHFSDKELGLNEESIYALCEDRYGKIWMGNAWGVFVANKNEMKFKRMDIFGLNYIYDLLEDSEGYIWVATMGNGVYQYDQDRGVLNHYVTGGDYDLSSNSVSSITEDHLGQIWFSTDRGGICVFKKKEKQFKTYSIKDGLPDDIAYKILEDKYYNLWFGTNQGLVRFNPESKAVKVFTQNDGLLSNQFNYKSGLVSSSGKLYFGSLEGLIAFKPEEFKENKFIPPVYITRLSIFNKEVEPCVEGSPLVKSIVHTDKIVLDYNQSNISFDFVSLSYTAPLANVYAYKMEDIDKEWSYTTQNRSATYAKLPPGKYTFMVKGANNDGVWNEVGASIEIEILPPWWTSKVAYFIYLILFILLSYIGLRFSMTKYKKRHNERQRLFEIEKEKELYEAKVDFFTDIAHEIRTPVTLINGPLESILEMDIQNKEIKHNLSIIEQNTKHLLALINQLLDFRKVDSNKFLLTFREVDIAFLCKDIIARFEQQALSLKRTINIHSPNDEHIIVIADKEGLSKIFSNLFSNAIKYSDKEIDIRFSTDDKYFTLEVSNDGAIVPDDLRERIFEPFFQVKTARRETSGSGIGLSLARSLAELHSGYLFYSSQSGLNTFTLKIPLYHDIDFDIEETDSEASLIPLEYDNGRQFHEIKNTKTILIVEDNMEMLNFIADKLRDKFIVERAANGIEAQKVLSLKSIDIVITDVMMPQMDGFELCRFIKSEIEYSHIIVVLLTARNDLPSKIQGLELGADAYVEKPFSFHYLQTLLTSLLNNRKREIELFLRKPFLPIQQTGMSKADEHFLNKIIDIINENITDPNFNVERLADLIYMSRSSLHRKIKSTMDSTPTDFIRFVRLQKAAELIQEGKYRINEICYLVGINSPSYFIKLFQTQYGMTPKEFEKQNK